MSKNFIQFIKQNKKYGFILFIVAFGLKVYGVNSYLKQPMGNHKVGYHDLYVVEGTLNADGNYICAKSDPFYGESIRQYFAKNNQVNFCRELMVRVYYPSDKVEVAYSQYYKPALDAFIRQAKIVTASGLIPGVKPSDFNELSKQISYTTENIPISGVSSQRRFPVLFFNPGANTAPQQYENIITELASNGYIIIAISNTFVGDNILFPDGRIVKSQPFTLPRYNQVPQDDILFVKRQINKLYEQDHTKNNLLNAMDLQNAGLFGHSVGGIAVTNVVRTYPHLFKAAASLDSPPYKFGGENGKYVYSPDELSGFDMPFMRMLGASWRSLSGGVQIPPDAQFQLLKNNYSVLFSPSEANTTYTNHMSFSDSNTLQYYDVVYTSVKYIEPKYGDILQVGIMNGWNSADLMGSYLLEFFNQYLKNIPSNNLQSCTRLSNDTVLQCGTSRKS